MSEIDTRKKFDFLRWRQWLREQAERLEKAGYKTEIRAGDKYKKTSTTLNIRFENGVAQFSNWDTGETDFEVHVDHKAVLQKWGLILDNSNFESTFAEFERGLNR